MKPNFRFNPAAIRWIPVVRCSIGFSIPVVAAILMRQPTAGVLSALGALYAGLASFRGAYSFRLRMMLTTSVIAATMTWTAGMIEPRPALAFPVILAVAFFAAIAASRGPASNTLGIQAVAVLVVISGIPSSAAMPLNNAGLVLAGGLIQSAVLIAFWPIAGRRPERRAVAEAFLSLSDFLRSLTLGDPDNAGLRIPSRTAIETAWDVLRPSEKLPGRTVDSELLGVLSHAEAIRAALTGFAQAYRNARGDRRDPTAISAICARLEEVAARVYRGEPIGACPPHVGAIEPKAEGNPESWELLIHRLIDEVPEPMPGARNATPSRKILQSILSRLDLRLLSEKHALRYAFAVAAAFGLSRVWPLGHAYWLPLTVCLTLREDYASTLDRSIARVAGTIVGVAISEAMLAGLHPTHRMLVIVVLIAGSAIFALYQANYAVYSAAITIYVVGSVSAASMHAPHAGLERLTATVAGALLAVLTNFLVPIWQSIQVRSILRDAVQSHIEFGERVLASAPGHIDEGLWEAQQRARVMHLEAERVIAAMEHEPRWIRRGSEGVPEDVLTQMDRNAAVFLALYGATIGSGRLRETALQGEAKAALERSRDLATHLIAG